MFHERSRPVGAAFLLAGICGAGAWSVVGAGASHHYDQRCGVPCRRKSRGGNATPAGTFYTVVYQLDDGTVKTEFWIVTSTSPTTIAAVRTTLGSGSSAVTGSGGGPFVSKAGDFMTGPLQLPGEKREIRRGVYDRIVNAAMTVAISAAIAMHDRWSLK